MRIDPQARLTCGHFTRVTVRDAQRFEFVRCPVCTSFGQPQTVFTREWNVWCTSAGCSWERWVGQEVTRAHAAKHLHMKRGKYDHVVRMDYAVVPGMEYAVLIAHGADTRHNLEGIDHEPVQPHLF